MRSSGRLPATDKTGEPDAGLDLKSEFFSSFAIQTNRLETIRNAFSLIISGWSRRRERDTSNPHISWKTNLKIVFKSALEVGAMLCDGNIEISYSSKFL